MIPLRDDAPSRTIPVINYVLIALNVFAVVLELRMGPDLELAPPRQAVWPGGPTSAASPPASCLSVCSSDDGGVQRRAIAGGMNRALPPGDVASYRASLLA